MTDFTLPDLRRALDENDEFKLSTIASDILDFELPAEFVDEALNYPQFQRFFIEHVKHLTKLRDKRLKRTSKSA